MWFRKKTLHFHSLKEMFLWCRVSAFIGQKVVKHGGHWGISSCLLIELGHSLILCSLIVISCEPNFYVHWSTSELRVRLCAPLNRFKTSSKIFLLTVPRRCFFCGSFMLFLSCFCYAFVRVWLLLSCGHLLVKRAASWLSFVASDCEVVTFPLVFWVRCCTWLYRVLVFALFLTWRVVRTTAYFKAIMEVYGKDLPVWTHHS